VTVPQLVRIIGWGFASLVLSIVTWALVVSLGSAVSLPYQQAMALLAWAALANPALLVTITAWLSPLFLTNIALWPAVYLLDVAVLFLLLRESLRRLRDAWRGVPSLPLRPPSPLETTLLAALIGFVGVSVAAVWEPLQLFVASWATAAPDDRLSWMGRLTGSIYLGQIPGATGVRAVLHLLIAIGFACYVAFVMSLDDIRRWWVHLTASASLASSLALAEYFGLTDLRAYRPAQFPLTYVDGTRRLMGLSAHPGWFAEFLLFATPGFIIAWNDLHRRGRQFLALIISVTLLAGFLTLTRSYLLAMVGGALGIGLAIVRTNRSRTSAREFFSPAKRKLLLAAAITALAVLGLAEFAFNGAISSRYKHLFNVSDRFYYIPSTIGLLQEAPSGVGLGLHAQAYNSFFIPYAHGWQRDHDTAHNQWLHLGAERGPFAPVFYTILLLTPLVLLVQRQRREAPADRALSLAVIGVLASLLVHGLTQFYFYLRVSELLSAVVLATAWRMLFAPSTSTRRTPTYVLAIIGFALVVILGWSARQHVRTQRYLWPTLHSIAPDRGGWMSDRITILIPASTRYFTTEMTAMEAPKSVSISIEGIPTVEYPLEKQMTRRVLIELDPWPNSIRCPFRRVTLHCPVTVSERALNPLGSDRKLGIFLGDIRVDPMDRP